MSAKLNPMTKASARALAGQGLMGVAKDEFPHEGKMFSFVAAFAEVEVDTDTGEQDSRGPARGGRGNGRCTREPRGQLHGGGIQGFGHARSQNIVYDPHYGKLVSRRYYQNKPPTILDIPLAMQWDALNIPDPQNPVGAKGIGEAAALVGSAAVLCAIQNAIGSHCVIRTPVTPDRILEALEERARIRDC